MILRLIDQLEMFGLEETRRRAQGEGASPRERIRLERRVEVAHDLMSGLPSAEDLSFLHSGLGSPDGTGLDFARFTGP
jgi:hypothetical protein